MSTIGEEGPSGESGAHLLDEAGLEHWGMEIGRRAAPPLVVALRGDLGAGKSTLARAIARGAGVRGHLPSPTFNLLLRYPADREMQVVHVDLYRLESEDEIWALGWSDLPGDDELVLIEWPDRAGGNLPVPRLEISLAEGDDPGTRIVSWRAIGDAPAPPLPREGPGSLSSSNPGPASPGRGAHASDPESESG